MSKDENGQEWAHVSEVSMTGYEFRNEVYPISDESLSILREIGTYVETATYFRGQSLTSHSVAEELAQDGRRHYLKCRERHYQGEWFDPKNHMPESGRSLIVSIVNGGMVFAIYSMSGRWRAGDCVYDIDCIRLWTYAPNLPISQTPKATVVTA